MIMNKAEWDSNKRFVCKKSLCDGSLRDIVTAVDFKLHDE